MTNAPPAAEMTPRSEFFKIGPDMVAPDANKNLSLTRSDMGGDLRQTRPYFVVPLDDPIQREDAQRRLQKELQGKQNEITDVFIVSHGWHRNFYEALSGYDRLLSRFAVLRNRRRCIPFRRGDDAFNPLILAVQWHSDPGPDEYYDPLGRRRKASFMQNISALFEPVSPATHTFTTDFEDMFALLSRLAAPGNDALNDDHFNEKSETLYQLLNRYQIKDALKPFSDAEKTATLWRCYNEAECVGLLTDQDQAPAEFMKPLRATTMIGNALLAGAVAIVGPLALLTPVAGWLRATINSHSNIITFPIDALLHLLHRTLPPVLKEIADGVFWWVVLAILSNIYLNIAAGRRKAYGLVSPDVADDATDATRSVRAASKTARQARDAAKVTKDSGNPLFNALTWLILQFPLAIACLLFCLFTCVSGYVIRRYWLWNERNGLPNTPPPKENEIKPSFREKFLAFARSPLQKLMSASATDSTLYRMASSIDKQLSVTEMQRKGAETGGRLADFLTELYTECGGLNNARIHFIGHSFGGVVVSNAARKLVLTNHFRATEKFPLDTLCIVQGAMASAWFADEITLRQRIRTLAAIYTRYDTATGFVYSFGFQARLGLGSVGLYLPASSGGDNGTTTTAFQQEARTYGHGWEFASLVAPPELLPMSETIRGTENFVFNLDASRFEYEGPPLSGGAHTDIYKDDLVNLFWGVVRLSMRHRAAERNETLQEEVEDTKAERRSTEQNLEGAGYEQAVVEARPDMKAAPQPDNAPTAPGPLTGPAVQSKPPLP